MIIGIGNDIVSVRRINKAVQRFGKRFEERIFTREERALAWQRGSPCVRTLSTRWASKEAFVKSLKTGFQKNISWKDISVEKTADGNPILTVTGVALQLLEAAVPENYLPHIHLTISDETEWANAFVLIEARRSLLK